MARFIPEANRGMSRLEKVQAQIDLLLLQQYHEKMSDGKSLIRESDEQVTGAIKRQSERNGRLKTD